MGHCTVSANLENYRREPIRQCDGDVRFLNASLDQSAFQQLFKRFHATNQTSNILFRNACVVAACRDFAIAPNSSEHIVEHDLPIGPGALLSCHTSEQVFSLPHRSALAGCIPGLSKHIIGAINDEQMELSYVLVCRTSNSYWFGLY